MRALRPADVTQEGRLAGFFWRELGRCHAAGPWRPTAVALLGGSAGLLALLTPQLVLLSIRTTKLKQSMTTKKPL